MKVLILNENKPKVLKHFPQLQFHERTTKTSTFEISVRGFKRLISKLKFDEIDIYKVLYW